MEYNQPYGVSDPDAPYINGDPSVGRAGSIPPAASIEYPQREIVNFITDAQLVPTNDDLHQLSKAVQTGKVVYGVDVGTENAMVAVFQPPIATLTPGLTVRVKKIGAKNTGGVTLDVGTGVNNVLRASGAVLNDNDLPANIVAEFIWDGSVWQMANFQGTGIAETVNNYLVNIPYAVDSGTVNAMVASFTPAITALTAGLIAEVKAAHANTGPVTLAPTGLAIRPVVRPDGTPLQPNDIPLGAVALLIYDGASWQLNNDLAIGNLNIYNITNAPFADVAVFSGVGQIYAPYYTKTMTPFSSMTGGSAGNVQLSGGYCRILVSGRYVFTCATESDSVNGNDPYFGLVSGLVFYNGSWRLVGPGWGSTGGSTYIKEDYGGVSLVMDCVAGDLINLASQQTNPGQLGYWLNYTIGMQVSRVR